MSASNKVRTGEPACRALGHVLRQGKTAHTASGIVQELYDLGFIIVPQPYQKPEPRARRGKVITDDPWIGKSHSARLCGG